jgi:hypothetical protein
MREVCSDGPAAVNRLGRRDESVMVGMPGHGDESVARP